MDMFYDCMVWNCQIPLRCLIALSIASCANTPVAFEAFRFIVQACAEVAAMLYGGALLGTIDDCIDHNWYKIFLVVI